MSLKVSKSFFSIRDLDKIKTECFVEGAESFYGPPQRLRAYAETANSIYFPFAFSKNKWGKSPNRECEFPTAEYKFRTDKFPFKPKQAEVFREASDILRKHRSVLLSLHCGFGKTYLAIRLAQATGLKCAILAHRGVLFDQWVDSIQRFTTAKVQKVDTDGNLDPEADFYIFNIAFVHKGWSKQTQEWRAKSLGKYKDKIGVLVVDEAHTACAMEMSKALLYFNPRIAIALTATPTRKDGMDKVLELYFGKYAETQIVRIAKDPFVVYRYPTGIKPDFKYTIQGRKDWNSVIQSLVDNDDRNDIILDLIKKFQSEFTILVLTKRKDHCKFLASELDKLGIKSSVMTGTDKKYDKTAGVLLSTYSKLGVGFDDTRLNMLIVACSVTEIEQYAGRLRCQPGKRRVIIDLVDDDSNCKKHWSDRRKWYVSRKGEIKHYHREFPKAKAAEGSSDEDNDGNQGNYVRLARKK